jgi:surface carbohydrate biosynthesis protein
MSTPRIALIVDHPQRDLAGLVLTAMELCQRGAVCHLVSLNLQEREIWALAPDLVVLNYFRRCNEPFARRLKSAGIAYGLLDTEGGVWKDVGAYAELLWPDDTLMKSAAFVCAWGSRLAEHLVREERFAGHQVTITGCPRFDFYDPAWRPVLVNGAARAAGSKRLQILINTLYHTVNSRISTREANAEELEAIHGWSRETVERALDAETRAIEAVVEMAGRLSRDFPEADILLRPHPFESPDLYRKRLGSLPNVTVDGDGPVTPRIFRAAAVIQRSCTTAVEAALAGVPALSPQWVPAPSVNPMSEAVSEPCESYGELESRLRSILGGGYRMSAELSARVESVVLDWFHRNDGRAHERVGEVVARSWSRSRAVDEELCRRYLYGLNEEPAPLMVRLGQRVRHAAGLSPNWSFRELRRVQFRQKRAKDFDATDVGELSKGIEKAWQASGRALRAVRVKSAAEGRDYADGFLGQSVTLACET